MSSQPVLIGNQVYACSGFGSEHPLAMPKTAPTIALIKLFDWFDPASYIECREAIPRRIKEFHDPDYVDAAFDAETSQTVSKHVRLQYGLGSPDNPIFPNVIHRAAVACGAALTAADYIAKGISVYSPLGGAHHAEPARASGFGYFNDIVLGILKLQDAGFERIAYVDLDAHHGNAVEDAFSFNRNVLTISIHQENCWPYTGVESDPGYGVINIPVPAGFNDTELSFLMNEVVIQKMDDFRPDVIVVQAGSDSLEADLMMDLGLSNGAYFNAIKSLRDRVDRIWITGGGGYNPWAVVPCWAGIWCVLNDKNYTVPLPAGAAKTVSDIIRRWPTVCEPPPDWLSSLLDTPRPGPIRDILKDRTKSLT